MPAAVCAKSEKKTTEANRSSTHTRVCDAKGAMEVVSKCAGEDGGVDGIEPPKGKYSTHHAQAATAAATM